MPSTTSDVDRTSASLAPLRPAGPGLPESCLWACGYLVAQALVAGGVIALLLIAAYGRLPGSKAETLAWLLELQVDSTFLLTGVTSLGAVFLLAAAARLRLGRTIRERLYVRAPEWRDVLLTIGAVAPLAVVSNALYRVALDGWSALAQQIPELATANPSNTLQSITFQAGNVPFTILLVALALGPAIGEELVFRGVIGEGLVRRWGLLPGVLLASLLFAATHLFPPHALATLPLAVFFHFAYLVTRNFWVPVLLHCLNNALCLAMLKFPLMQELPDSPLVLAFAGLYVLVIGGLLWRPDAAQVRQPVDRWTSLSGMGRIQARAAMAGSCILGFTTTFVWSVMTTSAP